MQSLLTGKIFDSEGNRMAPSHTNKRGVRYRYYISRALLEGRREGAGNPARIRAEEIEALVVEALRQQTVSGKGAASIAKIDGHADDHLMVSACLDRVDIFEDRIALTLRSDQREAEGAEPSNPRLVIPCSLGFAQPYQRVVEAEGNPSQDNPTEPNARSRNRDRLIVAIHKARGWLDELTTGQARDIVEIAHREGKSRRNVSMMINLAFVAPSIIEHVLDSHGTALTATALAQALPDGWEEQWRVVERTGR